MAGRCCATAERTRGSVSLPAWIAVIASRCDDPAKGPSLVGTARCAVRAQAGATFPAALPPGTPQRGVPTNLFLIFVISVFYAVADSRNKKSPGRIRGPDENKNN